MSAADGIFPGSIVENRVSLQAFGKPIPVGTVGEVLDVDNEVVFVHFQGFGGFYAYPHELTVRPR